MPPKSRRVPAPEVDPQDLRAQQYVDTTGHYASTEDAPDMVNHPPHYQSRDGQYECITVLQSILTPEEFQGYLKGCAFAYQWRLDRKGDAVEDARKAVWYLDRLATYKEEGLDEDEALS